MGSGIYRGFSDLKQHYVYDTESGNRMVVSQVETIAAADGVVSCRRKLDTLNAPDSERLVKDELPVGSQSRRFHLLYYDDISNYSQISLPQNASGDPKTIELCHDEEICCSLTYTSTSSLNYSFLAYSGLMYKGNGTFAMYIQLCSLVWCLTDDINTCSHFDSTPPPNDEFGSFTITGNFSGKLLYPIAFTRNFALIDNDLYSINVDGNIHTLSVPQESQNLMTIAMLARWHERDPSSHD